MSAHNVTNLLFQMISDILTTGLVLCVILTVHKSINRSLTPTIQLIYCFRSFYSGIDIILIAMA